MMALPNDTTQQLAALHDLVTRLQQRLGPLDPDVQALSTTVAALEHTLRRTAGAALVPEAAVNQPLPDTPPASATRTPTQPGGGDDASEPPSVAAEALAALRASEARYRALFDTMDEGFCVFEMLFDADNTPQDYRFLELNPVFEQMTGLHDAVGKTARELVPDLEAFWFETYGKVALTGEAVRFEQGSVPMQRWFEVHAFRFGLPEQRQVALLFNNITARKLAEHERDAQLQQTQAAQAQAEAERQRLYRLLMYAPAAICILHGPEYHYTLTNARYEALVRRHDLLGQSVGAVFPEVANQGILDILDRVRTRGEPFLGNEVLIQLDRDGTGTLTDIYFNFIYAPIADAAGTVTDIFCHAVDVTDLVRARQQADAAVVLRDEFLSIAAHELKTPLTSLLGYAQVTERRLVRSGSDDASTQRRVGQIVAQAQRLNTLIDALLDVSRINEGRLSLAWESVDLAALVRRVVDTINDTIETHTIALQGADHPLVIDGDVLRLEQVLVNLLNNAVKYTPDGGTITLQLTEHATQVRVAVQDTGLGIPAAAMPHIFERFYRVGSTAAEQIRGTGIGLFVVKEIVTLHGGGVMVASTEGVGSTFTVCLPRSRVAA